MDLSGPCGKNSEKSLHESDLLDRQPSLVFMVVSLKQKRHVCQGRGNGNHTSEGRRWL